MMWSDRSKHTYVYILYVIYNHAVHYGCLMHFQNYFDGVHYHHYETCSLCLGTEKVKQETWRIFSCWRHIWAQTAMVMPTDPAQYWARSNIHSSQFIKYFLKLLATNCFINDFSIFDFFCGVWSSSQDLCNWHVILGLKYGRQLLLPQKFRYLRMTFENIGEPKSRRNLNIKSTTIFLEYGELFRIGYALLV